METRLPPSCEQEIRAHAEETFPHECCGALLGRDLASGVRDVAQILRIDNSKDENRERRYLIEPRALLRAEGAARNVGLDVVGIYHSHPNHPSLPSDFDRDHAMPFWSYVIVSCIDGQSASVQSWRLREDRSQFDEEILRP